MKRFIAWATVIVLLLLDWAAFDDITTDTEPDYTGEYAMLAVSFIIFTVLGYRYILRRRMVHAAKKGNG